MGISYKESGVDIKKADVFIASIRDMVYKDRLKKIGAFGDFFDLAKVLKSYKAPVLVSSADGVGTKLNIAQKLGAHDTVGIDLVAMNVNDLVCLGAKPLFFLDYIACGSLRPVVLKQVMQGIFKALKDSDCVLLGGETAEMPGMYKPGEYDLAGFCCGVVEKRRILDGKNIKPGDTVLGLGSSGLHSNGFSLVRKVFSEKELKKYSKYILKPTRLYVRPILSLLNRFYKRGYNNINASCPVKAVAHNTGGAFYNKITKIIPEGLGFRIQKESWQLPFIFRLIQRKSGLSDKDMFTTFNMGIGMVAVVDRLKVNEVIRFFDKIEYPCYKIGEVVKSDIKMRIV